MLPQVSLLSRPHIAVSGLRPGIQTIQQMSNQSRNAQMNFFLKHVKENEEDGVASPLVRIISEGYFGQLRHDSKLSNLSNPGDIALEILKLKSVDSKELSKTAYKAYSNRIREHIKSFNKLEHEGGGSSTRTRRKLARNHRRTQYTNKHKRSSKVTKRATIKHRKSYRKHNRTVKRRKSRRHH